MKRFVLPLLVLSLLALAPAVHACGGVSVGYGGGYGAGFGYSGCGAAYVPSYAVAAPFVSTYQVQVATPVYTAPVCPVTVGAPSYGYGAGYAAAGYGASFGLNYGAGFPGYYGSGYNGGYYNSRALAHALHEAGETPAQEAAEHVARLAKAVALPARAAVAGVRGVRRR